MGKMWLLVENRETEIKMETETRKPQHTTRGKKAIRVSTLCLLLSFAFFFKKIL